MASIVLLWQMNTCYRFKQAEMAAATVPSSIQAMLEGSDIHISRRVQTLAKIAKLIDGGASCLSVITDFDHTLTRAMDDGGMPLPVTHQVLGDALVLPDLTQKSNQEKLAAYSKESAGSDRLAALEAWWARAHNGVVASGLTRDEFIERTRKTNIQLRDSVASFLQSLSDAAVLTLIFSAGLSDAISVVLADEMGFIPEDIHVVGNEMVFDENKKLVAFQTPLLHPYNKNAAAIDKSSPLFSSISTRPNLFVLGDSVSDLTMEKGLGKENENTLRIGFLNGHLDKLQQFINGYDIVIASDQSMDIPMRIIEQVLGTR